jgi:hypothetical protein
MQDKLPFDGRILDVAEYKLVLDRVRKFTVCILRMILASTDRPGPAARVIASLLARAVISLESIFVLYERDDHHNCMLILRSIIDRILHVGALGAANAWEDFIRKTVIERHKHLNKINSSQSTPTRNDPKFTEAYEESKRFVRELEGKEISGGKWIGIKPETVSKAMGLKYVYDFGYDHASTYVHPMAGEGLEDIGRLQGMKLSSREADPRVILQNACLSYLLLINNSLPYIKPGHDNWVSEFMDRLLKFTGTGDHLSLKKADLVLFDKLIPLVLKKST